MTHYIRPAEAEDHDPIVKLWHQGWHDAHHNLVPEDVLAYRTFEHFHIWLEECADTFFVALAPAGIVGFHSIDGAELVKLYVQPASRGSGLASELLSHAEHALQADQLASAVDHK